MKNLLLVVGFVCLVLCKSFGQEKFIIETSFGEMIFVLYDETPFHKENFIKLIKSRFFDGCLFHRVIPGFMIQGGDPDSKKTKPKEKLGNGGPGYTLPAEFHKNLFHKKGVLAAARQPDRINSKKESSGSQFYIVEGKKWTKEELIKIGSVKGITFSEEQLKVYTTIGGYPPLDQNYTVFGEVISGLDVISKISNLEKDENNRPVNDVKFKIKTYSGK